MTSTYYSALRRTLSPARSVGLFSLGLPPAAEAQDAAPAAWRIECSGDGKTLEDPLLASVRTGTLLKVTVFDANKRPIRLDVPLLGFGLAYDQATKA